jgi:transglutaminase 1
MDYRSSSSSSTTVLRRGQPFFMAVRMKDRNFDPRRDILRASFSFGICRNLKESKRLSFIYLIIVFARPESSGYQGNQSCFALPHEPRRI